MLMVVQTRAVRSKPTVDSNLKCPSNVGLEISKTSLIKAQKSPV